MIIEVNNKRYSHPGGYTITQKYNAIADSFELDVNRKLFDYILEYPEVKLYTDAGDLLLTGTIFAPDVVLSSLPQSITLKGYSTCGVIEDCTIPVSSYPLQFDNLSLADITEKLLAPFNVGYNIEGDVASDLNKTYPKTSAEPSTTIKQYLNDLASQRNIFMTSNEFGEILYTRFDNRKFLPTAFYKEGNPGLKKVTLKVNSQFLHSEITVLRQATRLNPDAAEFTIVNPYVQKYRPVVRIVNSGDGLDIEKAARNALSAELSMIKIALEVTKYTKPGTTIELEAESIELTKSTELFVEETVLKGTTANEELISLTCVVPEVYTDTEVKNIFTA